MVPSHGLHANHCRATERFNGRISDVLKTNRFDNALDLEQTLMRYVHLYDTQLPQSALGSRTPMQAMKDWQKSHPHLFVKTPRNRPGRNIYSGKGAVRLPRDLRNEVAWSISVPIAVDAWLLAQAMCIVVQAALLGSQSSGGDDLNGEMGLCEAQG